METITMGYIGYIGIILGYLGIMEKKMETITMGYITPVKALEGVKSFEAGSR